ncbi:MAG TPA: aspartate/glutamate racemase family protein [Bradyrhizobium sp.]|jgi:allantoin racemase|nr:aspartate/glutamate racemase family protein [Bradyrhizobium sp.]
MRILWLSFVDAAQNTPYFERLSRYLNDSAAPGTTVDIVGTSPPDRDFGRLTEFRCAAFAIDRCIEAEAQHYDAFVMGHFQDPGLYEARSAVRIPVVGAGEATLHFAAQLGRRLGLVSIDPVFEVWHHEQAERYGLRDRISGVVGLGFVPEDFAPAFAGDEAALARMRATFEEKAHPLVAAGADVILPAGVLPALLLCRQGGYKVRHAPVVNCASVALKTAEMAVALHRLEGLEPSRGPSFALAPERAIADFRKFVARGRQDD